MNARSQNICCQFECAVAKDVLRIRKKYRYVFHDPHACLNFGYVASLNNAKIEDDETRNEYIEQLDTGLRYVSELHCVDRT